VVCKEKALRRRECEMISSGEADLSRLSAEEMWEIRYHKVRIGRGTHDVTSAKSMSAVHRVSRHAHDELHECRRHMMLYSRIGEQRCKAFSVWYLVKRMATVRHRHLCRHVGWSA